MTQKPPRKPPPPAPLPGKRRNVADPSEYDASDNATWPPADDDPPDRDPMRDLEDPTFGFPIGSIAGRHGRPGPEDESTQVGAVPPPASRAGRPPTPVAARAARFETPTIEFTAYQPSPDESPPRRDRLPPVPPPHRPHPAAHRAPAPRPPPYESADSADFDAAPAPVDNSLDDLVEYADVPGAPPVDVRVVVLLGIFALSVLMLIGLAVIAAVVYL